MSKPTKLTKNSMIEHLKGESVGLSDGESKELLNAFFETLEEELVAGNNVKFHKFGSFKPVKRAGRKAKNFSTGEEILTAEKTEPTFIKAKEDD